MGRTDKESVLCKNDDRTGRGQNRRYGSMIMKCCERKTLVEAEVNGKRRRYRRVMINCT